MKRDPLTYRPGRALRTTAGVRARSWASWIGWGVAVGFGSVYLHLHLDMFERLAAVVGPAIGVGSYTKARLRSYDVATRPAHAALKNGNPEIAEREFTTAGAGYHWPREVPRINDYNRAMAVLRQGRFADAIALLVRVEEAGGVIKLDGAIASNLAYAHALAGNVELAAEWQREAERRFARYTSVPAFPGLLSDVAVGLRTGDAARIRRTLEEQWVQIESSLTGERMRPMRVFRAFAVAQTSDVREAGAVAALLTTLGPTRPGEFAYLGTQWPELAAFLAVHLH